MPHGPAFATGRFMELPAACLVDHKPVGNTLKLLENVRTDPTVPVPNLPRTRFGPYELGGRSVYLPGRKLLWRDRKIYHYYAI
jgi:hypothetical protein